MGLFNRNQQGIDQNYSGIDGMLQRGTQRNMPETTIAVDPNPAKASPSQVKNVNSSQKENNNSNSNNNNKSKNKVVTDANKDKDKDNKTERRQAVYDNNLASNEYYQSIKQDKSKSLKIDGLTLIGEMSESNEEDDFYLDKNDTSFIRFPDYSITDYLNTFQNWRKQLDPFASQGFFYFKIFFNFDTSYGLLGGVKNAAKSINTAEGYLSKIEELDIYKTEMLDKRRIALLKFINHLAYISEETPWFFREISGLSNIRSSFTTSDDFKNNYINIHCLEDSADMRLNTLFDLYKFACYNNIRNKEVIPSNLKKFEMSILFFHMPLRKYHTEIYNTDGSVEFNIKNLYNLTEKNKYNNIMSFKMYTFQNCEFDVNSLTDFGNDAVSNENPFALGKNTIKISYERVYEHMFNEFDHILVGQDIFLDLANDEDIDKRFKRISLFIKNAYEKPSYNDYADVYENLYGNFTNVHSKYYNDKVKNLKEGTIDSGNIYERDYGRYYNEAFTRVNSQYLNEKLRRIKEGGNLSNIPDHLAKDDGLKLKWSANAIKNSNNMYMVDGVPSTKQTWGGRLLEAMWQRTKNEFTI